MGENFWQQSSVRPNNLSRQLRQERIILLEGDFDSLPITLAIYGIIKRSSQEIQKGMTNLKGEMEVNRCDDVSLKDVSLA